MYQLFYALPMGGGGGTNGTAPFILCPPGPQQLVCCDVIDHGVILAPGWGGKPAKPQHKITIRWQSQHKMADGRPFIVQRRFTLSAHPKSSLRQYLQNWRGREFTDDEAATFDVERLIGVNALGQVSHVTKPRGIFAELTSIMPPMPGMKPLAVSSDYIRVHLRTPQHPAHDDEPPVEEPDGEYRPQAAAAPTAPAAPPAPPDDKPPPF